MKADRLIALLLLLQSRQRCTARELAGTLEVSERTVYRDIDSLCAAGVPVYAQPGASGGIALSDGYRRALTQFNEDEIRALFVSGASALSDLGLDHGLDRALMKLHGGLADVQQRAAEKARSRIYLDGKRWNQQEPPRALLATLRRAVWDDRGIRIRYRDRTNAQTARRVDPLGLVSKAGVWYLVARAADELRTFRVDRIVDAAELREQFERPRDFDLARHWSESSARFARNAQSDVLSVTVRTNAGGVERVLGGYWSADLVEQTQAGAVLRIAFPHEDAAVFQLLAWAGDVVLEEPDALGEAIASRARLALKQYAR